MPLLLRLRPVTYPALWLRKSEFQDGLAPVERVAAVLDAMGEDALSDVGGWRQILAAVEWADVGPLATNCDLETLEREHIISVLNRAPTLSSAAATLGIAESTLWRKLKVYREDGECLNGGCADEDTNTQIRAQRARWAKAHEVRANGEVDSVAAE